MIRLLLTSGRGPAECRLALTRALDLLQRESTKAGLGCDCIPGASPDEHGPGSAIVLLEGEGADMFATSWTGSALWVSRSPLRPHHKRKNWFVGIFRLEPPPTPVALHEADVKFEALRAGGAGGQHQNTTDSAVRAVHLPTGLSVIAREERSQHRNKATALRRLSLMLSQKEELIRLQAEKSAWESHEQLERGNPVRRL